jgi:hypothetical protein
MKDFLDSTTIVPIVDTPAVPILSLGASMPSARRVAFVCSTAVLVVACAKKEQPPADTTAPAAAAAPAPAPAVTLADFAGKWQVTATPMSGKDTSATNYTLTATADTSGWMIEFPSGVKVPVQVTLSGDSVMNKTATFSSQRRKGVKVWTEGAFRMQGGQLSGTSTAHYQNAGADSVLQLRIAGTKMP